MKRNRCPYPVKDNDLKSPNPKDSRPTEAKPDQANPCVRRNLARDFENPSEDQSSGEDSGPLHMSPVNRAGSVTGTNLLSVHMGNFSPVDRDEIQETKPK